MVETRTNNMSASTNGVKPGFFGRLKGLFRRSDEPSGVNDSPAYTATTGRLAPPPVEVAPVPSTTEPAQSPRNQNGNSSTTGIAGVAIPLQSILSGLPVELRPKVRVQAVGDLTVSIPVDKVLSQLGQGLVQVPFGLIRQAAPHVFAPGIESDRILVALPLNEILSRINPALLVRRTARKQVEVPSDITSPFESHGQGLSISVGNAKPVQPAAPRRAAPAPTVPVRGSISSVNAPPPPSSGSTMPAPIPFSFTKKANSTPATTPTTGPIPFTPAKQANPFPAGGPTPFPTIARAATPPPQPSPFTKAVPSAAASGNAVLAVPLRDLSEGWGEGLHQEIAQQELAAARVALPMDAVETALKRGRVTFTWKVLRSWIRPAMPPAVSPHDAVELELPLRVIAPLFVASKQAATQSQQKLTVDEEIPNLFFGFPQPEAPTASPASPAPVAFAPPAPRSPSSAPAAATSPGFATAAAVAASLTPASVQPAAPKPVDTNYYIWDDASDTTQMHLDAIRRGGATGTEFVKSYASPNEIVSRAAALDGVAGALIALPDGLMVASRIPTELNADTLAAFLPQLFSKVSQCTKELRMGDLNNLNFTVGNVPWKIFRVNAIFFAVFGRAAQALPTAQLVGLAAELDRKNK